MTNYDGDRIIILWRNPIHRNEVGVKVEKLKYSNGQAVSRYDVTGGMIKRRVSDRLSLKTQ